LIALVAVAFALGNGAQVVAQPKGQQQTKATKQPAAIKQQPTSGGGEQRSKCPDTSQPNVSCETVIARASEQQASAAWDAADATWAAFYGGIVTAIIAGIAAGFAAAAARAARDTVKAFTAVESAALIVTLEEFSQTNEKLLFKTVANNVGRSSALIVHAGHAWTRDMANEDLPLVGPPKSYIVKAGSSVVLDCASETPLSQLNEHRYLWLLIVYNAPLSGQRFIRYCFEVWGLNSNVPYLERRHSEWDALPKKRMWWFWRKPA
jgi:hypothetical protein